MFIGEYSYSIDDKGRISIPVKFRGKLSEGCVVTRGLDHCLWLYPLDEWEKLAEELAKLPITQKDARSFSRLMLAGAMDLKIDKIGRVNLPGYLKEYAGIKSKVVITGMYNRLEIWPEEKWGEFKKNMEENSEQIAENLSEIGF
jgi:MraZ protein